MTSKHRIAIAVAGIFLGAQIGMAALSELQETAATEGAEQESVAESTAPELSAAEAPAESEAASPETNPEVPVEQTVEIPQRDLAAEALAEARQVELVIPTSASESYQPMLPAMIAYFERRGAPQMVAGSTGDVFPASASEAPHQMLPAMIAYFDRREAAVGLAAAGDTVVAAAPAAE